MSNFKESIKVDLNSTKKSSNRTSTSQKNTKTKKRINHYRLTPKGKKFVIKAGIFSLLSASTLIGGCYNSSKNAQKQTDTIIETVTGSENNIPVIEKDSLTESELRQIEDNPIVDNYNLILQDRLDYISKDLQLPIRDIDAKYPDEVKHLLQDMQLAKLSALKYKIACATGFDGYEINSESDLTSPRYGKISVMNNVRGDIPSNAYIMINNRYSIYK